MPWLDTDGVGKDGCKVLGGEMMGHTPSIPGGPGSQGLAVSSPPLRSLWALVC